MADYIIVCILYCMYFIFCIIVEEDSIGDS